MALGAYRFVDKRQNTGYAHNLLFDSATQQDARKSIPYLDYDYSRNVSNIGRRVMLSLGRNLFANNSIVRGALLEQAEYASSTFLAQYEGRTKEWGRAAEAWMQNHDSIIDRRGWGFNARIYRRNLILHVLRDGDMGTILTKTVNGYPQIQCMPAHRISSMMGQTTVDYSGYKTQPDGTVVDSEGNIKGRAEWDKLRLCDGVISDDYGMAVAYRVIGESPWDFATFQDISARDMFLSYDPLYCDQLRGHSVLGAAMFDWQDVGESRKFELIAQKAAAAISMIETNEDGEPRGASEFLTGPTAAEVTAGSNIGTPTGLYTEIYDGGLTRYFRSKTGSNLQPFHLDRPSAAQQQFEDNIVRAAFHGMNWDYDFSLNSTKIGGASMRVVVEKINRRIKSSQDILLAPACKRIDGYRVSKAIKLGLLANDIDWWKFGYQGPAEITADKKYDSDVDRAEIQAGLQTRKEACARRGDYWEEVDDQKELETDRLLARAQRLSEKYDITIQEAITLLSSPTPNGMPNSSGQGGAQEPAPAPQPQPQEAIP